MRRTRIADWRHETVWFDAVLDHSGKPLLVLYRNASPRPALLTLTSGTVIEQFRALPGMGGEWGVPVRTAQTSAAQWRGSYPAAE